MCINPLASDDWYATIDAIFKIKNDKLFSPQYKSLNIYIQEKWKSSSRATFNNLALSGQVVSELKQARVKDLPANVAICLAIASTSIKYKRSVIQVWNLALDKYKSSKNVVSSQISSMYQEHATPTSQSTDLGRVSAESEADSEADSEGEIAAPSFRKRKASTASESSCESCSDEIGFHDRYSHIRKNGRPSYAENGK
jgi:hypothetical protein